MRPSGAVSFVRLMTPAGSPSTSTIRYHTSGSAAIFSAQIRWPSRVSFGSVFIYFVIFASVRIDKTLTAIIAFGINSGAYQAEIFRSGINSVPKGQFEAGRSLGFNYGQTMVHIIMPQAFRVVVPTLCNEYITLLKETSVAGYIALEDLTKGGDIIRSRTYSAFMPLIAVALIYLIMVLALTKLVSILERRLSRGTRK